MEEDSIMLDRLYLIKLIDQLRNFEGSEEDEDVFLEKLENLVTDVLCVINNLRRNADYLTKL